MNPLGVGVDIVDVARIERLIEQYNGRALRRLLTEGERDYCLGQARPALHVAARLAAKEAAYKAIQGDDTRRVISWREIEVQRDIHGRPTLALHARAQRTAALLGVRHTMVSLSHSETHAVAVVLLLA